MIPSNLPHTPLEKVALPFHINLLVKAIYVLADIFGFWKGPRLKASADFESMSLLDKIYWGYKSRKPITQPEKGLILKTILGEGSQMFSLPQGFLKKINLSMSAVGDLYKTENLETSSGVLYKHIHQDLFDKDISIANLESQLTNQEISEIEFTTKEGPPLCCNREQFDTLKGHGGKHFSLLNTACNHSLDMGEEGVTVTLDCLEKEGIINLGTQLDSLTHRKGRIIEKNGFKIGFVSATYGINGKVVPDGKDHLVNLVKFHNSAAIQNISLIKDQISHCRDHKCDFIVASIHWGYEYEFFPRINQVKLAHELIEWGADMIVAHHPHVVQPVELYRPYRDPERVALIAYSLGNLTNPFSAPHLALSFLLEVSLVRGTLDGKDIVYIESAGVIPVVQIEKELDGAFQVQIETLDRLKDKYKDSDNKKIVEYIAQIKSFVELVNKKGGYDDK